VAKIVARVRAKDIKVHLDATAVEFLIDKGYDPIYGARPMRRAVEKYLEDPLAAQGASGKSIKWLPQFCWVFTINLCPMESTRSLVLSTRLSRLQCGCPRMR